MGERHEHATAPSTSAVRAQLDRILAHSIFTRSERLSVFLRFVVEQTLDGKGNGLKEQVLGAEIYSKGPEFDGAANPIVRVDAAVFATSYGNITPSSLAMRSSSLCRRAAMFLSSRTIRATPFRSTGLQRIPN